MRMGEERSRDHDEAADTGTLTGSPEPLPDQYSAELSDAVLFCSLSQNFPLRIC